MAENKLDIFQVEQDQYQADIVMEENIRGVYNFEFDKKTAKQAIADRYCN